MRCAAGRWSSPTPWISSSSRRWSEVEIDCDLKLPGRRGRAGRARSRAAGCSSGRWSRRRRSRACASCASWSRTCASAGPTRRRKRDWTQYGWASPALKAGLAALRRRYPGILAKKGPELNVDAVWVYHLIITPKAVEAAHKIGVELIAWTVDDVDTDARAARDGGRRDLLERPAAVRGAERQAGRRRGPARPGSPVPGSAWCRGARRSATPPRPARSRAGPRRPTRA